MTGRPPYHYSQRSISSSIKDNDNNRFLVLRIPFYNYTYTSASCVKQYNSITKEPFIKTIPQ